jgi:glycosyltransferase involved in cell wall biosynthesis
MTASSASLRIWITVSHPGMDESDTIGDMVRLKRIREVLGQLGHSATIITLRNCIAANAGAAEGSAAGSGATKRLIKRCLPRRLWATLKDMAYQRSSNQFRAGLEARRDVPDLIIDYNFYWSDAAIRFAKQNRIPFILNVESLVADSIPEVMLSWVRKQGEAFEMRKYRGADRLWTVSAPLATALIDRIGVDATAIDVVPNAASRPAVPDVPLGGIPAGALVLGFVGGFADWYSLDRLVAAFLELRRQFPQLTLLLVGDGPERPRIESLLQDAPHDAYVLPGKVPHVEVSRYIARMDLCVITNHTWWSSPLKLLEYGAQGKPVIAPNLPSITSMVSTDEVQFFRVGDFREFTTACSSLLADPETRRRLGSNLLRAVETRYSPEAMAERIHESLARLTSTG